MEHSQPNAEVQHVQQRFLPHHIKIMKVALALAIIRQKPEGLSVREFTERLALQFSQLQTDWQAKAVQLEQELLRTRQELIKYQIQTESLNQPYPDHAHLPQILSHPPHYPATNGFLSQDSCYPSTDSEWQSSGYCSSFPEGGGRRERMPMVMNTHGHKQPWSCGASEDASVKGDGCLSNNQQCVDRDRWKGEHCESEDRVSDGSGVLEERVRAHVKFLFSVSSLVNAQHHLSVVTTSDLRITLRDTVLSATRGISEALSSRQLTRLPLSQTTIDAAIKVIVEVLRMPVLSPFESELMEASVTLTSTLIERLVQHQGVEKGDQLCLRSQLCMLCHVPRLFRHVVETMAQHMAAYTHTLSGVLQDSSCVDADMTENMAALLKTLEVLLSTYDATSLPQEVRMKLAEELETSIFEVSETFPLFTYSVWKITALLSPLPET